MKTMVLMLIALLAYGNTLPKDLVCNTVDKATVEKALKRSFKHARAGSLPIEPPYDVSFCEYLDKVLPIFSIYYFGGAKSYDTVIPPFDTTQEIKGIGFDAKIAIDPSSKKIVQLVARTQKGVLSFIFSEGVDDISSELELMKQLRTQFK